MSRELSFVSDLKATGHGEVWDHTDQNKFKQFGWRCTTNESSYSTDTLVGNWSEQKFDIHRMFRPKPIPSSNISSQKQILATKIAVKIPSVNEPLDGNPSSDMNSTNYAHYFETTYKAGHCPKTHNKVANPLRHMQEREPTSFPGHQPELDVPSLKSQYNAFTTTSREAYKYPRPQATNK